MDIDVRSKESKAPFPGMCKSKITFDTEVDPLNLHKVKLNELFFPDWGYE
jgi:hypothetical protein